MKIKYLFSFFLLALLSVSCSTDDAAETISNEVEGLIKVQELSNDRHIIELYNRSGKFKTGYNQISIRLKDIKINQFVENARISWSPMMEMSKMSHSAPKSSIQKAVGKSTVYEGFMVFQMTNLDGSGWSLNMEYTINDVKYTASSDIVVLQNEFQNVTVFTGADEHRYVLALIQPENPKIAVNKIKMGLYKMESMMDFPVVKDFKIIMDPRMPGMGNHGSPNNTDLEYNAAEEQYEGKLSLTMSGYWVLNLKLFGSDKEILRGEAVTEDHPKSSLYLELNF